MRYLCLFLVSCVLVSHRGVVGEEGQDLTLPESIFSQVIISAGEYSMVFAFQEFQKHVPPEKRLAALVAIWDHPYADPKDSLTARSRVCAYLSRQRHLNWDSYPPLCLRIHSMLLSTEPNVRAGTWQWLAQEKGPEYVRPLLIAGLSDPDERVRSFAVWKLAQLGDALPLLEEYVRLNRDNPKWEISVPRAKAALEKARGERPNAEKDAAKKP